MWFLLYQAKDLTYKMSKLFKIFKMLLVLT